MDLTSVRLPWKGSLLRFPKVRAPRVCSGAPLCLTLCDPLDCSPPGFSVHGIYSPGKNTGAGCHFLLQAKSHILMEIAHEQLYTGPSQLNILKPSSVLVLCICTYDVYWASRNVGLHSNPSTRPHSWWAPSRSSQRQHHGSCSDQGSPAMGLPRWCSGKESTRLCRRCGFDPWVRKIVWSRKQYYCIVIFLPGKSHGQRSLVGYCLGGLTESDMTEQLSTAPADPQGWCRAILHLSSLIDGHCLLDGAGR